MNTNDLRWKVNDALRDLDKKQNYTRLVKDYIKEKCSEAVIVGGICLSMTGIFAAMMAPLAIIYEVVFANKKVEAYETNLPKTNFFEQKYSDLAERVSEKTGVDERILLGLISGGNTTYANELRETGYAGIVPIRPEEAGVTAEVLNNDDEQCLMSAAQVFRKAAEGCTDLEAAVSGFWYREKEEEADSIGDGWQFITAAINAYHDRANGDMYAKAQEALMYHQGALKYEKMLAEIPEEKKILRRYSPTGYDPLTRKIKNPALLFRHKATIDAYERYRAGDEDFTWIDLLPVKLGATIYCSVAYMGGVELNQENSSGE